MAKRISLGNGRWFTPSVCKTWQESTTWDGRNHVSDATGSQWEHEQLYLTPKGTYVLHAWSQWQGSRDSYSIVDAARAAEWLLDMGHFGAVDPTLVAAGEL